jgi:hypothetical protein
VTAARSKRVGDEEMSEDIRWIRSYVVDEGDGEFGTFCIYQASSPEKIREHAARADIPVTDIYAVADTLIVRPVNVEWPATRSLEVAYFSVSTRMNGAGRVGWLASPSTRTRPSKVTRPVAVASRCCRLLPGPLTVVSSGPTPVHDTSNETSWVPPRLSLAIPDPVAVTLLRFSVLVIVAGAVGAAQLNEVPSGQTARNCTLAVGSGSSVSGASKSRVLNTSSVPCTVEPSAHKCGTAQNADAVSSKNSDRSADADVENAKAAVRAASATAQRRRADVEVNM